MTNTLTPADLTPSEVAELIARRQLSLSDQHKLAAVITATIKAFREGDPTPRVN
jgi:hypothetical protein